MEETWEEIFNREWWSIVNQNRTLNAFKYSEPKWIPFKKRTLINKIKSVYYTIRYFNIS